MLRVRVELVPWGVESMAEEIACIVIGRDNDDEDFSNRLSSRYKVTDDNNNVIGRFTLHRYGWHRNRLGLAARGLKLLQLKRDRGKFLPAKKPFGYAPPYER